MGLTAVARWMRMIPAVAAAPGGVQLPMLMLELWYCCYCTRIVAALFCYSVTFGISNEPWALGRLQISISSSKIVLYSRYV